MNTEQPDRTLYAYRTAEEAELAETVARTLYRYDRVEDERIASLRELTEAHVKRFWERGYLVIEQALSDDEVESAIEAVMDIIHGRSAGSRIQFVRPEHELGSDWERELAVRKLSEFIDHEPRLAAVAAKESILSAMGRLFGEPVKIVQDQAILKPPSGGAEKPWHQDMAYGNLAYDRPVIGAWFALDEAGLDNGCMHVIPYSHRDGAVPHYAVRDWQLCDTAVRLERDVAVPLKPGGVLLFSGLLHHGTPPNFTDKRRRSVQIHYAPQSAEKLKPGEYKRMFTNAMSRAEC
ncbi:phytanoyl-CoA dioxygenase family protein [Paenibacillus humicola]|uniref:phytanoyl-CoA dioxygenase family protein n=1 Tax=Paenibacillus humicola TaxID=3110540 RepID=UPI00237A4AFC|nr:phytanoyl-CoA dioxygenase family protein [Paenibacillus humicola]